MGASAHEKWLDPLFLPVQLACARAALHFDLGSSA